jgi:hypothetical protein
MNEPAGRISQDDDVNQHTMSACDENGEDTNHWVPECGECGEAFDYFADVFCVNPECTEHEKRESPLRTDGSGLLGRDASRGSSIRERRDPGPNGPGSVPSGAPTARLQSCLHSHRCTCSRTNWL